MESVEEGLEAEGARPDRGSATPLSSRIRRRQTKDVTLRLDSGEMDSMERGRGAWVRRRWRNVAGPHGPGGAVPHGERASRPGGATPPLGRFGLAGEGSRDSETARALTVMIWLEMAAPAKHVSPWNGP